MISIFYCSRPAPALAMSIPQGCPSVGLRHTIQSGEKSEDTTTNRQSKGTMDTRTLWTTSRRRNDYHLAHHYNKKSTPTPDTRQPVEPRPTATHNSRSPQKQRHRHSQQHKLVSNNTRTSPTQLKPSFRWWHNPITNPHNIMG